MSIFEINIAKDFSPYPAGRTVADGPNCGENFRKKHLIPAYEKIQAGHNHKIRVVLDGVRSFGSSFLDEAFGGFIRELDLKPKRATEIFEIQAGQPVYQTYKRQIDRILSGKAVGY